MLGWVVVTIGYVCYELQSANRNKEWQLNLVTSCMRLVCTQKLMMMFHGSMTVPCQGNTSLNVPLVLLLLTASSISRSWGKCSLYVDFPFLELYQFTTWSSVEIGIPSQHRSWQGWEILFLRRAILIVIIHLWDKGITNGKATSSFPHMALAQRPQAGPSW